MINLKVILIIVRGRKNILALLAVHSIYFKGL